MKVNNFNYENAAANLKRIIGEDIHKATVRIYTICDHVSKSGMSRNIKAFTIKDNEIINLGYGRICGCGMDMGYHVAECIFSEAYPQARAEKMTLQHSWV